MKEYIELMIGLTIGLSAGAGAGWYFAYKQGTKTKLYQLDVFREKRKAILRRIVWDTGAINCLVLKIHNGGSELAESSEWYSSVVEETPQFVDVSAADTWQNIKVDDDYRELIRQVRKRGKFFLSVDEMKESFLKRTYIRMGIEGSLVMSIYQDEYFFYYVSFPTRDFAELVDNKSEYNRYELAQLDLMRLYEKYHRLNVLVMDWKFKT